MIPHAVYLSHKSLPLHVAESMSLKKICLTCKKPFARYKWNWRRPPRFCSLKCIRTPQMYRRGSRSQLWKGNKTCYSSKHAWIKKVSGSPKKCSKCGRKNKKNKAHQSWLQWANKDHKYSRNKKDYIPLCPSCHKLYDNARKQKLQTTFN